MDSSQISQSYDRLADRWAEGRFDTSSGLEQHRRAIAFTQGRGKALDVGCGANSRLMRLFIEHGFEAEGIDVSPRTIELAKTHNPDLNYRCVDVMAWQPEHHYDLISAWDSIWHLPIASQIPLLEKLTAALSVGGVLIFTTGGVDEAGEHTDDAMGQLLFYGVLGIPRLLATLEACGLALRHFEFDQHPEKHLLVIAQKTA